MKVNFIQLIVVVLVCACVPASDEIPTEVVYSIQNENLRKSYNYQDKQQIDSLLMLTADEDPTMRFVAANAFASYTNDKSIDALVKLLDDPSLEVKQAAAYALGQQRDVKGQSALLGSLQLYDSISYNNRLNSTIMEAVGKLGATSNLDALATAANIKPADNNIILGQVRGIYRYLLDGKVSTAGTNRILEVVGDRTYSHDARLIAANYLSRANELDLDDFKFQLHRTLIEENNPDIKLALANAMKHVNDPEILKSIMDLINGDADFRVKVNLLKNLGSYKYIEVIEKILDLINDKEIHVANAAADYLVINGQPADASLYANYIKDEMHWSTKAKIYQSILTHLPRNYTNTRFKINNAISNAIKASENPYEKAAYINALSADVVNFKIMHDIGSGEDSPIVNTALAIGYRNILSNPSFNRAYRTRNSRNRIKRNIAAYLKELIETRETGAITESANIIANEANGYQALNLDFGYLGEAVKQLDLPKEVEALYALQGAMAYIDSSSYEREPPVFNNPIDWSLLDNVGDSTRVNIITEKGNIRLKLFAKEAPGTVANFVKLANSDYYDDKVFHRVVPGFVIQGGCPIGDGYGSEGYTIRSEFSQLYYDKPGIIGMASAGPHTEGVQFFITQAPTPHLDGKYTIFGEVLSGMDVVNNIQVGDKIEDVQILN